MRMAYAAMERVRATLPFWNASGGRDHVFLFSHDEGGCFAPEEVATMSSYPRPRPPPAGHG